MNLHWNLLVDKNQIPSTSITTETAVPLGAGQIEMQLERFALTANNVTYALLGKSFGMSMDNMGYWDFFPYSDEQGLLPVWGIASVSASEHPDVQVGTSAYGFFPLASHSIFSPGKVSAHGFIDMSEHRQMLPPIYNHYTLTDAISNFEQEKNLWPVFRPLYVTGFMISDEIMKHELFGATRIVVASASSKTAMLFAHCLRQVKPNAHIVGLTSEGNRTFVTEAALYDDVVTYDNLDTLQNDQASVYVDMAGNGNVIRKVYDRLGDSLKSAILVGKSHWDSSLDLAGLSGPRMNTFFAPEIVRQRTKEWGPALLQSKLDEAWQSFLARADSITTLEISSGPEAAQSIYTQLVAGNANPEKSRVIELI